MAYVRVARIVLACTLGLMTGTWLGWGTHLVNACTAIASVYQA